MSAALCSQATSIRSAGQLPSKTRGARHAFAAVGVRKRGLATVYLGLGSNVGDRHKNLLRAYNGLRELGDVCATSSLYETPAMYVEDQPSFLNGACRLSTDLDPSALLGRLKNLEATVGRVSTKRWGPRAVDVDILLYDDLVLSNEGAQAEKRNGGHGRRHRTESDQYEAPRPSAPLTTASQGVDDNEAGGSSSRHDRWLEVPHPRMHERPFVLRPLADINPELVHPLFACSVRQLLERCVALSSAENAGKAIMGDRVLPMGFVGVEQEGGHVEHTRLWPLEGRRSKTYVMGILNSTPDSFSDGGQHDSTVSTAVEHALNMTREGADMIDVGGESTRPGAAEVSVEEEISRVVPVIEGIRSATQLQRQRLRERNSNGTSSKGNRGGDGATITISVDTRRAAVARAAVEAGAHAVNDVSGGMFDPDMLEVVAELGVPFMMMHMRGTPQTMTSLTDYGGDVVGDVCDKLNACTRAAELAGIPRWMHVLDPGIGFAKTQPQRARRGRGPRACGPAVVGSVKEQCSQRLQLLGQLDVIRERVKSPLLVGPSRKRFIGELLGEKDASRRDWGTAGACCAAAERGISFVRVHNVEGIVQALAVADAIRVAAAEAT